MNLDLHIAFTHHLHKKYKEAKGFTVDKCIEYFYDFFAERKKNTIETTDEKNVLQMQHQTSDNTVVMNVYFNESGAVRCIYVGYSESNLVVTIWEYTKRKDFEGFIIDPIRS